MRSLADTSAWVWAQRDLTARAPFRERVASGDIAICAPVKLELLSHARTGAEFDRRADELDALPQCPVGPVVWLRAVEVYRALAHIGGGHQRSVKHPELLIAAAGEAAGLDVLHYDEDFDRIAAITGQPVTWLAERVSL